MDLLWRPALSPGGKRRSPGYHLAMFRAVAPFLLISSIVFAQAPRPRLAVLAQLSSPLQSLFQRFGRHHILVLVGAALGLSTVSTEGLFRIFGPQLVRLAPQPDERDALLAPAAAVAVFS